MFVALSQFTIANDMSDAVRDAFRRRLHRVDDAPGFVNLGSVAIRLFEVFAD